MFQKPRSLKCAIIGFGDLLLRRFSMGEYQHQAYPKWLYGPGGLSTVVDSEEAHLALDGEWWDSPADVPMPTEPPPAEPPPTEPPPAEPPPAEGEADASAAADEDTATPRRRIRTPE